MTDPVSLVIELPAWALWMFMGVAYPIVGACVVWVLRWWGCFDDPVWDHHVCPNDVGAALVAMIWPVTVAFWAAVGVVCVLVYPFYVLANLGRGK